MGTVRSTRPLAASSMLTLLVPCLPPLETKRLATKTCPRRASTAAAKGFKPTRTVRISGPATEAGSAAEESGSAADPPTTAEVIVRLSSAPVNVSLLMTHAVGPVPGSISTPSV